MSPSLLTAHGSILSYTIRVLDENNGLLMHSTSVYTSYHFPGVLSPFSNYSVEIYVNTSAGSSPSAYIQIQTLQDGNITLYSQVLYY